MPSGADRPSDQGSGRRNIAAEWPDGSLAKNWGEDPCQPVTGMSKARSPTERGRSSGVEHNLAKVGVEGSNPFARSKIS